MIADGKGNTIFSRELDREVGVEGLQIARQHGALQLFRYSFSINCASGRTRARLGNCSGVGWSMGGPGE